ncbi:MAG: PRD domain-containing protein [Clostridium sp.]|uniref:PRD domain-containing protein n=1 Tax=Clostridium sp. TaxID=1506 RepID=UPI002A8DA0C8|nr:PRD domain-containing protein [Clostridium sp.]MDY5099248.1 PRD domain-containing protein [Clostridium sp.]
MNNSYKIVRLINNNVVMCKDREDKRCMLIGKGIGFKKQPQDVIRDLDSVEKIYYLVDESNAKAYKAIVESTKSEIIGAVEEAITLIEAYNEKPLNESIHVTLLDHINFAISRMENKINIKNPLLHEIKFLYTEEFLMAEKVIEFLNEKLQIKFPYDEVGFVTMHIHAAITEKNIEETSMANEILSDILHFLDKNLGHTIRRDSLEYFRFLTHLRFSIDRAMNGKNVENLLIDTIRERFENSYTLAERLSVYIYDKYKIYFNDGEIGYIALHLQNILNEREQNKYISTI